MSVAAGRLVGGVGSGEQQGVPGMGKASRQRRQKNEQERRRQRAPQAPPLGPGGQQGNPRAEEPSLKEQASVLIAKAAFALVGHQPAAYERYVDHLSTERVAGWSAVVSLS